MLIGTLAYSVIYLDNAPAGCVIVPVTDKVQVHLLLKVRKLTIDAIVVKELVSIVCFIVSGTRGARKGACQTREKEGGA